MEYIKLILTILLVWRLCHMLSHEDGPGDVFFNLRIFTGARPDYEVGEWVSGYFWGKLITCPLCLSVWFALPFAVLYSGSVLWFFLYWFGISGAAGFLELVVAEK